ncbi:hypothetical protein I204_07416 [Kwoniella mangroviensis CBS 8886]|nr:uncharacterized protein I203_04796 [Kwoniella mangroviensis CBS 8507]OCF65778.1 hypothetical protein I203_04796 [Kwoniella mangroviensis CBS 8507]OCF72151.1 hypothetical protein I204_07416 [Kwoniella mangroviensis CBS 8886]
MKAFTALLAALATIDITSAATGYLHKERSTYTPSLGRRWSSNNPYVTVDGSVCTVKPMGGGQDDGPNLLYAFNLCGSTALINLPGYYTVNTVLQTYLNNVEVRLTGAISYVPDIEYWSPASIYLTYQNATTYWFFRQAITIYHESTKLTILYSGSGITLHGGGTIDANGQTWWDYYAQNKNAGVAGGSSRTFARPIPLTVGNASNVVVDDISVINSPFWHNLVYQSTDVTYSNIQIRSISSNESAEAANSDGWDIYRSSYVTIKDSNVQNGDDCVSFKPNSTYMTVENMICNGSHGISVGSLGQYAGETDIVANVYVRNISMSNAQNGARIKVFGGSNDTKSISGGGVGYVKNVTFQDFVNYNVDNPIYLTQCYSSSAQQCQDHPSTLSISDVYFINISGSASGLVPNNTVATLECSAECVDITASGTQLSPKNGTVGSGKYLCANLQDESTLDFQCTDVPITKG